MARIATVYSASRDAWDLRDMSFIRWQKISESLARLGHEVDIVSNESLRKDQPRITQIGTRLRRVPLEGMDWSRYDVVKTLFHDGFDLLEQYGGVHHPFIVAKLGSVVAAEDKPGIYFYGEVRRRLYETQEKIHRKAHYVTVLSRPAGELLQQVHGKRNRILLVPGGVEADIPEATHNPFVGIPEKICLFSGNIYFADSQPEANIVLVRKLNALGELLQGSGIRVCFLGLGDTSKLDKRLVTNLGSVSYEETWNWLLHATVGIVVSAGPFMHNNESSKIYHYLRAGLPVVSEAGFPNDYVIRQSGLGFVVPSGDMKMMAEQIRVAAKRRWDRPAANDFIRKNHTWDARALTYDAILPRRTAHPFARAQRWVQLHPTEVILKALRRRFARRIEAIRTNGPLK